MYLPLPQLLMIHSVNDQKSQYLCSFVLIHILEVGKCTLQDVDLWVDVPCNSLQNDDIGQQGSEFAVQLHVVLSDDGHHVVEESHSLQFTVSLAVEHSEDLLKFFLVVVELLACDLVTLIVGQVVDHIRALISPALYDSFNEVHKYFLISFFQLNHHTRIKQVYDDLFFLLPHELPYCYLLLHVFKVKPFEGLRVDGFCLEAIGHHIGQILQEISNFSKEVVRLVFDLDEDIPSVAIGMDEVILHQHFEKGFRAKFSNDLVQRMPVELEVSYRLSFNKGLDQDHLLRVFFDG